VPGDEFVLRIVSVIQAGDVASVVLEMHAPNDVSNAWVDIHSLLRFDGVGAERFGFTRDRKANTDGS
jgi:hypothetical protein